MTSSTTVEAHDFPLPITRPADLRAFVRYAFGVEVPDAKVCPDHTTPWRAFCHAYFARTPISVWKASRGFGGKSFLLALLGLTEAATLKIDVNILGGSGEQAIRVHEHMQKFWNHPDAPRYLLASDPSKRETKLTWGNAIQALMASQASVRGPHPVRLRLDETDEIDLPILDAALGQPMSKNGVASHVVMSSTHQHADGTMTEILRRAAERSWPVHTWCYRETLEPHGWLAGSEVSTKRGLVTAAMWQTEYEGQEPSPESRAIQPDKVAAMFRAELGKYEGAAGEYIEIEKPQPGAAYATGADWARKQDWTVIVTLRTDCKPWRVVAFERTGREPWPVMVAKFDARCTRFKGGAAHDGTGVGDVVSGYMTSQAEAILMVGRARSDLLSNYIAGVERGEIVSPYIRYMAEEHRYASVDDVYGSGHLPDSIAAMSVARKAAEHRAGVWSRGATG